MSVNGERVAAGKVIITTGARPAIPAIPGIGDVPYLTSNTALDLEVLPRSLIVIGGGYIGAELAQMFARAGVAVSMVFRTRPLPAAEPEISEALQGYFADEGISVISGVSYRAIRPGGAGVCCRSRAGRPEDHARSQAGSRRHGAHPKHRRSRARRSRRCVRPERRHHRRR